jgi:hypothetical protein
MSFLSEGCPQLTGTMYLGSYKSTINSLTHPPQTTVCLAQEQIMLLPVCAGVSLVSQMHLASGQIFVCPVILLSLFCSPLPTVSFPEKHSLNKSHTLESLPHALLENLLMLFG